MHAGKSRRQQEGEWLGVIAWIFVIAGVTGILADSFYSVPLYVLWLSYLLSFTGPPLFALSAVLKAPVAPRGFDGLPDPWARKHGRYDE